MKEICIFSARTRLFLAGEENRVRDECEYDYENNVCVKHYGEVMINRTLVTDLEERFGVKVLPVKIIGGRRWSFEGKLSGTIFPGESKRIQLDTDHGVIIYNWQVLTSGDQEMIEKIIKENAGNI